MKKKNKISVLSEPLIVKWVLTTITLLFLGLFLVMPLVIIFKEAFKEGIEAYLAAISDPEAFSAIKLTLIAAIVAVFLNLIFGISAAWAITKFDFRGKNFLITLIDLPLTVSPVISGMIFVLFLGSQSYFGSILAEHDIQVIFAVPGIILATVFVTFPYIAREVIPHMREHGRQEEEAALTLGASGWKIFYKVTLPNIKWSLVYGLILCNARAMGEFGAVSVVSGHIRGLTNTLPLHIEILYNEYNFSAAFAVATLLTFLALLTIIIRTLIVKKVK